MLLRDPGQRDRHFWPGHYCGLQMHVLNAVISLARPWVELESTKSLFLAKAKANVFSADFFPLVFQPITSLTPALRPTWEILLVPTRGAFHEAGKKAKGTAASAPGQNAGLGREEERWGAAGGGFAPEVQEQKGRRKLSSQTDRGTSAAPGPEGGREEGSGPGPLGIFTGQ